MNDEELKSTEHSCSSVPAEERLLSVKNAATKEGLQRDNP